MRIAAGSTSRMTPVGRGVPSALGAAVVPELDPLCTALVSALSAALLAEVECAVPFVGCFPELHALPWPAGPPALCTGGAAPPVCLASGVPTAPLAGVLARPRLPGWSISI
eukprot:437792-Lingulodinium_polyedra.AAC.1